MPKRITVIQGHPDPRGDRYGHALAAAYAEGAKAGRHELRLIDIATIDFPVLRTQDEWNNDPLPPTLKSAQDAIGWADHLVILFPLWLGTMPALLKAFLVQTLRPGFAIDAQENGRWKKRLAGKSARIVVTMGMPALIYRWYFGAHGLKGLERNILKFCGISPIRESLIGMVASKNPSGRTKWLARMRGFGEAGT
jgi:putative NADPH-quinone reductase